MSIVKKQDQCFTKRTSHFYKKRLQKKQELSDEAIKSKKVVSKKIDKKAKDAKMRAKQARQRKKKYIHKLEQRILQLQSELYKSKQRKLSQGKQIHSSNSAFVNLNGTQKQSQAANESKARPSRDHQKSQCSQQSIKLVGLKKQFHRLYKAVSEQNQGQAADSVNCLRGKFGVAGEQRVKWIKQLFSKIVQAVMPMHCRLLLENCQNGEEFYKLLGGSQSLRQFRKVFFDSAAKDMILSSRPAMTQIRTQYQLITLKTKQLQQGIFQHARRFQAWIDRIEQSMNPLFVGRILVNLDIQRNAAQDLRDIFPVNYYQRCFLDSSMKMQNRPQSIQLTLKERQEEKLQKYCLYCEDFSIFDQLFRID